MENRRTVVARFRHGWDVNPHKQNTRPTGVGTAAKAAVVSLLDDMLSFWIFHKNCWLVLIRLCRSWFSCSQCCALGIGTSLLAQRSEATLSSSLPGAQQVTIKRRSGNDHSLHNQYQSDALITRYRSCRSSQDIPSYCHRLSYLFIRRIIDYQTAKHWLILKETGRLPLL